MRSTNRITGPKTPSARPYSPRHYRLQQFQFSFIDQPRTMAQSYPPLPLKEDILLVTNFKDKRKELIKQKIKFRMKEQILKSLKIIIEKPIIQQPFQGFKIQTKSKMSDSTVYVKGQSFKMTKNIHTHLPRRNILFKESKINLNKSSNCILESTAKRQLESSGNKKKRVWSSAVKMRDKDRMQIKKVSFRVNRSAMNFQKLQNGKIEPWVASQQSENYLSEAY